MVLKQVKNNVIIFTKLDVLIVMLILVIYVLEILVQHLLAPLYVEIISRQDLRNVIMEKELVVHLA
jgi:hypothetical protein